MTVLLLVGILTVNIIVGVVVWFALERLGNRVVHSISEK